MGSFGDLNTYSETAIVFTDLRNPGPRFNIAQVEDISFTSSSGSFQISRGGLEILDIIRPAEANVRVQVDVSAVAGTSVAWPTVPAGSTVTNVSGVYEIDNIQDVAGWDLAKQPVITLPSTFNGSFFYDVNIVWYDGTSTQTLTWTVGSFVPVSVMRNYFGLSASGNRLRDPGFIARADAGLAITLDLAAMSAVPGPTNFIAGNTHLVRNNPRLVYADTAGETWTVTVTPSNLSQVTNITSAGTGADSTSYSSGVYTIVGGHDAVNTYLDTLSFTTDSTEADFNFVYYASNNANNLTATRTQLANCRNVDYLDYIRGVLTYGSTQELNIGPKLPLIYDSGYTGSGSYTYTVTVDDTSKITAMGGSNNTYTGNGVLTFTGTKDLINSLIDSATITPSNSAYSLFQDIGLTISLTTPSPGSVNEQKTMTVRWSLSQMEVVATMDPVAYINIVPFTSTPNSSFGINIDGTRVKFAEVTIGATSTLGADLVKVYPYLINHTNNRTFSIDDGSNFLFPSTGSAGDTLWIDTDYSSATDGKYYNMRLTVTNGYLRAGGSPLNWQKSHWINEDDTTALPPHGFTDPSLPGWNISNNIPATGTYERELLNFSYDPTSTPGSGTDSSQATDSLRIEVYEYDTASPSSGTDGTRIFDETVTLSYQP